MSKIKYSEIEVDVMELFNRNENACMILGRCSKEMRRAKVSQEEKDKFFEEATSGDYQNILKVCKKWFTVY